MEQTTSLTTLNEAKQEFALAMQDAQSLDIVNNLAAAFDAALIVNKLEAILTDQVMDTVFMPLMNKKIGFKTDRDPSKKDKRTGTYPTPYSRDVVRTCIIDGAANGLLPMGNQWNIISGQMYPTKEGYTALLSKMKASMGLVYSFEFDPEVNAKSADPSYVAIPCRISYKTNRDDLKGWFKYVAMVKSNGETSTTDQLRGKAERKCKKAFFEFLTGLDLGDADADTVEATYTEVSSTTPQSAADAAKSAAEKARELVNRSRAKQQEQQSETPAPETPATAPNPQGGIQPNLNFDNMTDEEIEAMMQKEEEGEQQ